MVEVLFSLPEIKPWRGASLLIGFEDKHGNQRSSRLPDLSVAMWPWTSGLKNSVPLLPQL